jgi:hypothetical protein
MNKENQFESAIRLHANRKGIQWIDNLQTIDTYELATAKGLVCLLLEFACQAQQTAVIVAARNKLATVPAYWLETHLADCARISLNLDEEWELRRFLEFSKENAPSIAHMIAESSLSSDKDEVREVAQDFL